MLTHKCAHIHCRYACTPTTNAYKVVVNFLRYVATAVKLLLHPQNGEELIENGHYAQDDIEARVESLFTLWDQLTEATKAKGRGLAEALSLMSFNRQVDTVHAMITDRVCCMWCTV